MDQVLYWNEVALEANRVSFTDKDKSEQGGPTLSSRALGIIHIAMHDAYVGSSNTTTFPAYLGSLLPMKPAPSSADPSAAVAGAAHTTLISLYPKQKSFFDSKLNTIPHILTGKEQGYQYGCMVAKTILELRKNDPGNGDANPGNPNDRYIPHVGKGKHKSDPDNAQGFLGPFYGGSKLFSATTRHALNAPPFLSTNTPLVYNGDYIRALENVREKGIAPDLMGTLPNPNAKRTANESLIGIFWAYDGSNSIGTPPKLYNQIVRALAMNNHDIKDHSDLSGNKFFKDEFERNVRLFALVNIALADAGILAWEQKYVHNFWRPVIGVREHDKSMGSTGIGNNQIDAHCDPMWLPLGAPKSNNDGSKNFTPDFPAYPSGHATFGSASLHIARLFFGVAKGDKNSDGLFRNCYIISDELNGVTKDNNGTIRPSHVRNFPNGLWEMIIENALSRIYLGVHWSFDAFKTNPDNVTPVLGQSVGGVDLGLAIAEDIFFNSKLTKSTA
ncbi:MAG: hypothetical protein ACRYFA_02815 [Janthinobacterium lividum]